MSTFGSHAGLTDADRQLIEKSAADYLHWLDTTLNPSSTPHD